MAFRSLGNQETVQLPFFADWKKELSSKQLLEFDDYTETAISAKEVVSGKGFVLSFKLFSFFIWKNSTHGKYIEALFEEASTPAMAVHLSMDKKTLASEIGILDDVDKYIQVSFPEENLITFIDSPPKKSLQDLRAEREAKIKTNQEKNASITKKTYSGLKPVTPQTPPIAP